MMQSILSGKPVIALPFNPDQFLHAFRFQELGLGKSLVNFKPSFLVNFYKGDWQGIQKSASEVSAENLLKTIDEILSNKHDYQKAIEKFIKDIPREDSVKKTSDIIEEIN